ncbi:hypothetical protein LUZ61_001194 [Rhynchospora tenuis]|uniref:Terpene synthase n=1 Tax=Rhynchospora tenuis TaxID=198213 RepID=A0AAD5ZGH1_9POAL|nr:hypothetical protein LUZ61_001194 [Rhynchospora tenuis]
MKEIGNAKKACKLKKEVRQMIYKEDKLRDKLELVDAFQQLGVAYHFKEEIYDMLTNIHKCEVQNLLATTNDDLYLVSLLFRVLRTNEFSVPEGIFKSYFNDNGEYKAKLSSDIKGMLSFHEASYLAKEGEDMLEMARHSTSKHLTNYLKSSKHHDSGLKERVCYALEQPLHQRIKRVHTRWLVEQYLCSLSWASEPEHSSYRIIQTQTNCLITTVDDMYDVYGSLNELEAFTDAIEKWDVTAAETLPEYMKMCCLALFDTVESDAYEVLEKKGLNVTQILRRAVIT